MKLPHSVVGQQQQQEEILVGQLVLVLLSLLLANTTCTHSAADHLVYVGCTLVKFPPSSPYQNSLNSLLASLINSASTPSPTIFSPFNSFKASAATLPSSDTAYGLYQCRGDLAPSTCAHCVTLALTQLLDLCYGSSGGSLQLDGCFVKYDNESFLGVVDRRVVYERCQDGRKQIGVENGGRVGGVMEYLKDGGGGGGEKKKGFREGGSGPVQGMAQCVGDLSVDDCQGCVSFAVDRLRDICRDVASAGDVFLEKCYARYWVADQGGASSPAHRRLRLGFFCLAIYFWQFLYSHLFYILFY